MPGTVTSDMTFFTGGVNNSSCDAYSATDWSGGPALWTDYFIQGTGALGLKLGTTGIYFLFTIAAASINLTGKIVMIWCADPESMKLVDPTGAKSALRIVLQDTSGRNAEWWMADTDSWYGEWRPFIAHADTVPGVGGVLGTTASGFDKTAIKKIGTYWKHGAAGKNTPNMYFDGLRYGTGITIIAGTSGSPATFADLVIADNLVGNKYGIVQEENGIIVCQGKLRIGSLAAATSTYFKDTAKVIVFPNRYVPDDFYEVLVQGNVSSPSNTTVFLGDPVTKVSGCSFRTAPAAKKFKFTATDVNVTKFGLRGCSFFEAATIALPPSYVSGSGVTWARSGTTVTITKTGHGFMTGNSIILTESSDTNALPLATYDITKLTADTFTIVGVDTGATAGTCSYYTLDREVINTSFEGGAEILPDTCIIMDSNIISSPARAIKISSVSHNVKDCKFINCQTAVHHNVGGVVGTPVEYDYDNLKFSGGTYHIENSAVTPNYYIDIDRLNGSNPDSGKINNSAGGTTTILPISVNLTLLGLVVDSDISILIAGTTTERVNVQEHPNTSYVYSYNYVVSDYVDIGLFKPGYVPKYIRNYLLGSTDGSLPIVQDVDRFYIP